MGKCISCGLINKSFKYIIFTIVFIILYRATYGYNYYDCFEEMNIIRIFSKDIQKNLPKHKLIHLLFSYIGIIFLSYILNYYEDYISSRECNNPEINKRKSRVILIHHNNENTFYSSNKSIYIFLFISFLWIFEEHLIIIYKDTLKDLDFWFFDILIISYFNVKMFKVKIYKHQYFAIALNIIPSILKIFTIYISWINNDQKIIYINNKWFIPIGIILFIILITIRSYVNSKIKWFIDLKYISTSKLLKYYGIVGAIISSITCIITTYVNCKNIKDINNNYEYICNVYYYNDKNTKYFDSFLIYFETFKNTVWFEKIIEIFIIIAGIIFLFFHKFYYVLVIKYLTPVHLIFSIPIFYFFDKSILLINNLIVKKAFFKEDVEIKNRGIKFILDLSGDILSFLGFLIYLEIIELNCFKFNYNTKNNITQRSYFESYGISKVNDLNNSLFNQENSINIQDIENDEDLSISNNNE